MTRPACCDRDVWDLPTLDLDAIAAEAVAWVADFLAAAENARDVAALAAEEIDRLNAVLAEQRTERNAAAWWVMEQYHVRYGANMPGAVGVKRVGWKKIRDKLSKNPPAAVADPLAVLPIAAAAAATTAARLDGLIARRDDAVMQLIDDGTSKAEAARLIGRDPAVVSTMQPRTTSAA